VPGEILVIPYRVFPESSLPDSLLPFEHPGFGPLLPQGLGCIFCEKVFDQIPPHGVAVIPLGQFPDAMQMIRQNHDGFDFKRMILFDRAKGRSQHPDVFRLAQKGPSPMGYNGKEEGPAQDRRPPVTHPFPNANLSTHK